MKIFKTYLFKLFKHRLVTGSLMMIVGGSLANVGNYFYHLLMGRMLGPKNYGELESVISLLYLLMIVGNTLTLVVVKYIAQLKGQKDKRGISWLFAYFNRQLTFLGGLVFLFMVAFSPLIAFFLHLPSVFPLILLGALFLIIILLTANRAVLQGLLQFKKLVVAHTSETYLKLLTAILLVWLGWGVNGALAAFLVGGLAAYWLTLIFLKRVRQVSPQKPTLRKKAVFQFALPAFFSHLSFTSLYTSDIILVKHFFAPDQAGLYAALAVLGKIIYFASGAIPLVMFPMIVDRRTQGKKYHHLLFFSFALVFLICLGISVIYFLFPQLMVKLLFGSKYLAIAPLVGWMGVFLSLYSLAYLLINFFLSIDRAKAVVWPFLAGLMQIILISFFHRSLLEVVQISICLTGLLLLSLVLYYFYDQKKVALRHRSGL